jgi:hypothetical protein
MQTGSTKTLSRFNGLNNRADAMRGTDTGLKTQQTWEWQSVADNVNGTDGHGMERREGYSQFAALAACTGSYSTFDYSRLYIIDSGALKRVYPDGNTQTLYGVLSGAPYWTEQNDTIYLSCGPDKLQIEQDNTVRPWGVPVPSEPTINAVSGSLVAGLYQIALTYTDTSGREGGSSAAIPVNCLSGAGISVSNIPQLTGYVTNVYMTDMDGTVFYLAARTTLSALTLTHPPEAGVELTTQFLDTPPVAGSYIAFFGANAYMAEYIPEIDQTVIWRSQEFAYHLFNLNSDYFIVPGEVTQLYGAQTGLLITTQTRIFVHDNDTITQVAEYGAVPGQHADVGSDGKIYFWSKRGLCSVMPFQNLTENAVSVPPGVNAGGSIVESNGYRRYVAVLNQGGSAFNRRQSL